MNLAVGKTDQLDVTMTQVETYTYKTYSLLVVKVASPRFSLRIPKGTAIVAAEWDARDQKYRLKYTCSKPPFKVNGNMYDAEWVGFENQPSDNPFDEDRYLKAMEKAGTLIGMGHVRDAISMFKELGGYTIVGRASVNSLKELIIDGIEYDRVQPLK